MKTFNNFLLIYGFFSALVITAGIIAFILHTLANGS